LTETERMAERKLFCGLINGGNSSLTIRIAAILSGLDLSHGAVNYCG
jgi:hypothetical protein